MSAQIILCDFKGKTWIREGSEPVVELTPEDVVTLQAMALEVMQSIEIPHYHEGDSGDCA